MKQDPPTFVGELRVLDKAVIFCSKEKWIPYSLYPKNHPSPHASSHKKAQESGRAVH